MNLSRVKNIRDPEGRGYVLASVLCFVFVITRYFEPTYFDNEWVYAINPIKILHPEYLKLDFSFDRVFPYFIVYDGIVSPFYRFMDYFAATVVCRFAIWAFQIWALTRLCRTLGLAWWGIVLLFLLWLNVGQALVAGEWIIGCASAKPVAYGFLFLALDSVLKGRPAMGGVHAGLAVSFHVLVGGWSSLAMIPAVAWGGNEEHRLRRVAAFSAVTLAFSIPGLLPALKDNLFAMRSVASAASLPGIGNDIPRFLVLIATPFHLDPDYFLTGLKWLKLLLFIGLSIYFSARFLPEGHSRVIGIFLGCLSAFFLSGLLARRLEWYWYLQYYPFRVVDGVVTLFFWIGSVAALQRFTRNRGIHPAYLILAVPVFVGVANLCLVPFRMKTVDEISPRSVAKVLLNTEPRVTAYWIRERIAGWTRLASGKDVDDVQEMETWIRDHTPEDSIFIAPPWKHSFALRAQRAQFVSPLKYIPSAKIMDWKKRMEILNRGPLQSVGRELWDELPRNYQRMSEAEINAIKDKYGAEYLLAPASMKLAYPIVRSNATWVIYKL